MVSGGEGPGILNFLIVEGVPRDAIVAEWKSHSTRENAIETAKLIQNMPGKKVLLTSDFHIYRAVRVFRKLGIEVTPAPVPDVLRLTERWNGRFSAFEIMVEEKTAKIVYYRLRGSDLGLLGRIVAAALQRRLVQSSDLQALSCPASLCVDASCGGSGCAEPAFALGSWPGITPFCDSCSL